MEKSNKGILAFLASRRRVWLPPVIFTVVIFFAAIILSQGKDTLGFFYRFF